MPTAVATATDRRARAQGLLAEFAGALDRGDRDATCEAHAKLKNLGFTVDSRGYACVLVDGGKPLHETAIYKIAPATAPEMARRAEAETLLVEYAALRGRGAHADAAKVHSKIKATGFGVTLLEPYELTLGGKLLPLQPAPPKPQPPAPAPRPAAIAPPPAPIPPVPTRPITAERIPTMAITTASSPYGQDPATGAVPGEFAAGAVPTNKSAEELILGGKNHELKEALRRRQAEAKANAR